jgi:molecular chaperone GrpE
MTGSHETPDGPGAEAPEAEVASGSGAASRAGTFGVAGEQIDPTVADATVIDAEIVDADVVDVDVDAEVVDVDEVIDGEVVDPLAAVTAQRDEYLDSLRRLQAEFENYRKRVAKQQSEQAVRATVSLVNKLLPVLDALDLAVAHSGDAESDDARALVAASSLLNGALEMEGLERIDPVGQPFDPNAHEAVGHLPAEAKPDTEPDTDEADAKAGDEADAKADDEAPAPDGPVVGQVMRAGYRFKGTVVRPAMVMVHG